MPAETLARQAVSLLDTTDHFGRREPETYRARQRLRTWLDIGQGRLRQVKADIAHLQAVVDQRQQALFDADELEAAGFRFALRQGELF